MFLNPQKIVDYSDVHHGMKVLDVGAGIGHYTLPLAYRVGKTGRVYALDVHKEALLRLGKDARTEGVEEVVKVILGDIEQEQGSHLKDTSLDRVFLMNTFFQIEEKDRALVEIYRILRPGGKVIFAEWKDSFGGIGPHPDHVVTQEQAEKLFRHVGFSKESEFQAGSHHYGILFVK